MCSVSRAVLQSVSTAPCSLPSSHAVSIFIFANNDLGEFSTNPTQRRDSSLVFSRSPSIANRTCCLRWGAVVDELGCEDRTRESICGKRLGVQEGRDMTLRTGGVVCAQRWGPGLAGRRFEEGPLALHDSALLVRSAAATRRPAAALRCRGICG